MKTCYLCGHSCDDDARYCPKCEALLIEFQGKPNVRGLEEAIGDAQSIADIIDKAKQCIEKEEHPGYNPEPENKISWKGATTEKDDYLPKWVSYIVYIIIFVGFGGFCLLLLWYL